MSASGCAGHASLAEELRQYADGALHLLEPLVAKLREQQAGEPSAPEPTSCEVCPVCALITVLRGGRSELAVRLAERATELLAVLRTALAEGVGGDPPAPARTPEPDQRPAARRPKVQRIPVARENAWSRPC